MERFWDDFRTILDAVHVFVLFGLDIIACLSTCDFAITYAALHTILIKVTEIKRGKWEISLRNDLICEGVATIFCNPAL